MGHRGLVLGIVLVVSACGKATENAEVAAAVTPETVAAPEDASDARATAPSEPDVEGAVAHDIGTLDEPKHDGAAVANDVVVAMPEEVAAPSPPHPPRIPGLAPEVLARLMTLEPGCVGLAKNGRAALWMSYLISESGQGRVHRVKLLEVGRGEAGVPTIDLPLETAEEIAASTELAEAVKGKNMVACRSLVGEDVVVPRDVPVRVKGGDPDIEVSIEGNRPHRIAARVDIDVLRVEEVFWSPEVAALFVLTNFAGQDLEYDNQRLFHVSASDVGQSGCVPRPVPSGKAPPAAPPPFDPAPSEASCVAMTADGRQAAFKVWRSSSMPGENSFGNTIEWHGVGSAPEPAVNLSCMVSKGCDAAARAALIEEAGRLGLVGCGVVKGGIVLDGRIAPTMYRDNGYHLEGGSGWRKVFTFRMGRDGEGHESLWKAFQHPAGGPVFLYVGNEDTGVREVLVHVMTEDSMQLCPAPGPGFIPVSAIVASSEAAHEYGVARLVDNDLTTSWQVADPERMPTIDVSFGTEVEVAAIEIANGFQRRDLDGDLFVLNARAARITLTFPDGSTQDITLDPDQRGLVRYEVSPRRARALRLTVGAVHEGTRWPKDLALSELRVFGRP